MNALFALGSNGSGQLGIGHREDVSVPKPAVFHPKQQQQQQQQPTIVQVAAGGNHTLLLTDAGHVFWSGDAAYTTTTTSNTTAAASAFQKLDPFSESSTSTSTISHIACTWEASFLVAKDDNAKKATTTKLYSLGTGLKGELGLGPLIVRTPSATVVPDFPPTGTEIVDISACMGHAVAVLSNGDAYGWGNCRKGQAGDVSDGSAAHQQQQQQILYSPHKVDGLGFRVTRAVCAKEATAFFGEPDSGHVTILGSDKWSLKTAAPAMAPHWATVGAGWGNFYILAVDGTLLSWGRDDHGQLPPPNLPELTDVAIGSEHVVALTKTGHVLSWGWGEHGNCGPKVENHHVKGRWNVIASSKYIPSDSRITSIGAGCATSWICITPR